MCPKASFELDQLPSTTDEIPEITSREWFCHMFLCINSETALGTKGGRFVGSPVSGILSPFVSQGTPSSRSNRSLSSITMKFASIAATALMFALPAFAQTTESVSYDTTYDDASLPLADVACSNVYGLTIKGYTTLGSLPDFPFIGGAYTVTGYDSPACGTCYNLTYSPTGVTISILAIDVALDGFNLSEEAMNTLTDGNAVEFGRVDATAVQVDASLCGL